MRTVVDKDHQRKLQRVENYTATIGVHDAASPCNVHEGMPLNFCLYPQFNGICGCILQAFDMPAPGLQVIQCQFECEKQIL